MLEREPSPLNISQLHQFKVVAGIFGPIRPSQELHGHTQRALKAHSAGRDFFTDITLHDGRNNEAMRVEYTVTASSQAGAERAGAVYLSQLCDLLSTVTGSPVWFYMPDEDSREDRMRMHRRVSTVDRILSEDEWEWITGVRVFLRRKYPQFLAAASWYRKGLVGRDSLDEFCCYWRVIERLACSYADKTGWTDEEKEKSAVRKCVEQLSYDLFTRDIIPDVLQDRKVVGEIVKLRNDLSHGNVPITPEVIDAATRWLKPLEHAAFNVLRGVRVKKLVCEPPF